MFFETIKESFGDMFTGLQAHKFYKIYWMNVEKQTRRFKYEHINDNISV